MNGPDQRSANRHSYEWKAWFGEKDLGAAGLTKDVSEVGAFISASALPKVGALIRVRFEAPTLTRPVLLGQVVRHAQATALTRPQGFGVKLISDRASMRQLIESAQKAAAVAVQPASGVVQLVTSREYQLLRESELTRGGLGFSSSKTISINQHARVEVAFLWNRRSVTVNGRVVRCDEVGGRFRGLLLLSDSAATLARLDEAAAAK